jgi:hypothetical protein
MILILKRDIAHVPPSRQVYWYLIGRLFETL